MTRAVFLDRDGVINRYPGDGKYVTSVKEFRFLPKVKEAIALLTAHKYPIFIISNQAGVGKGLYTQEALSRITEHMLKELSRHRGKVQAVYYCTHRSEDNCSCRKPKAGLIFSAIKGLLQNTPEMSFPRPALRNPATREKRESRRLDSPVKPGNDRMFPSERLHAGLEGSFFVGDTIRDVQTARAAGCRSMLIFSGQEKPANRDSWPVQPDYVFANLYQAAKFIVRKSYL